MRISDWSSDVCSSDLRGRLHLARHYPSGQGHARALRVSRRTFQARLHPESPLIGPPASRLQLCNRQTASRTLPLPQLGIAADAVPIKLPRAGEVKAARGALAAVAPQARDGHASTPPTPFMGPGTPAPP